MKMIIKAAMLMGLLATVAGCATSRSTIDLSEGNAVTLAAAQPAQGPAIKIVSVDDKRVFTIDPRDPSHPSLKDDNEDSDKAITNRAIARKRNTYGEALGDVLLPEGDTVTAHVTQALTDGFRQGGYRVLASGDAGYDQATPVTAVIKQFWAWAQPGFWEAKMHSIAEIELDGNLPALTPTQTITAQSTIGIQIGTDSNWRKVIDLGLQNISTKVAEMLKAKGVGS